MNLNIKEGMCLSTSGCDMALDNKYIEWTPELQEAWDKQQEREAIYLETDSVYRCMYPNCEVKIYMA